MRILMHRRVIARVSVDVTTPPPERKFDGIFQIVTEFSPMASPSFEVGRYVYYTAFHVVAFLIST